MTETEWLTTTDACSLLHTAWEFSSERKHRLLAVALARRLFPTTMHPDICSGIELAEQLADGTANRTALESARELFGCLFFVGDYATRGILGADMFFAQLVREALKPLVRRERILAWLSDYEANESANPQCVVAELRDIIGNPFRHATFSVAWRTDTAVSLARQMYESRDFSPMPILADALQDAGCEEEELLAHCRTLGPHRRGCWVVDAVLGKG